jgi:hypothetical protein
VSQGEFLRRIAEELTQSNIPYMLVGSLASSLHGAPRATQDIDIVIDPTEASLSNLLGRLSPDRYYFDADAARDAWTGKAQFNVVDLTTGWKADLVIRKPREFSVQEFGRRLTVRVGGIDVYVSSPEDTILSKLEWAAMGESERQLRDAVGIIAVHGDSLDVAYLEKWAEILDVTALLRRAFEETRGE